jgi:L-lactate permease
MAPASLKQCELNFRPSASTFSHCKMRTNGPRGICSHCPATTIHESTDHRSSRDQDCKHVGDGNTLAQVTGLPFDTLGSMVARQTAVMAVFLPLVIVYIADGARGLRECWAPRLITGLAFGIAQFVTASYIAI